MVLLDITELLKQEGSTYWIGGVDRTKGKTNLPREWALDEAALELLRSVKEGELSQAMFLANGSAFLAERRVVGTEKGVCVRRLELPRQAEVKMKVIPVVALVLALGALGLHAWNWQVNRLRDPDSLGERVPSDNSRLKPDGATDIVEKQIEKKLKSDLNKWYGEMGKPTPWPKQRSGKEIAEALEAHYVSDQAPWEESKDKLFEDLKEWCEKNFAVRDTLKFEFAGNKAWRPYWESKLRQISSGAKGESVRISIGSNGELTHVGKYGLGTTIGPFDEEKLREWLESLSSRSD